MRSLIASLIISTSFLVGAVNAQALNVVTSIKPVHSLAANIMKGISDPQVIVDGPSSLHSFQLRPSHAKQLEQADLIIMLGTDFETFLRKPIEALGAEKRVLKLEDSDDIKLLNFRADGAFEEHEHDSHVEDHSHNHNHDEEHAHSAHDLHLWLDPKNAIAISIAIKNSLIEIDPANQSKYEKNTDDLIERIEALNTSIAQNLEPLHGKPYIVFHDAYQYFENAFDISAAGSVTVSPETPPSAERVKRLQAKIKELNAACIFAEPEFPSKLVDVVTEGTNTKIGTLDPEGSQLDKGPDLYFNLMQNMSKSMNECLK